MALPAAQHVDEYIVILPSERTGDPKYCAVVSSGPSFFGTKTSVGGTVNLLVFQLYMTKPQPSAECSVAVITHAEMYGTKMLVLSGISSAPLAHRTAPAWGPAFSLVHSLPPLLGTYTCGGGRNCAATVCGVLGCPTATSLSGFSGGWLGV